MTTASVRLLGPSNIGRLNRARVLSALRDNGPLTRAQLARMSGVTRATIGNVVQSLLDEGLLEEVELGDPVDGQESRAGRPVWFSSTAGMCAVVTLSGGEIITALVNVVGDVRRLDTRRVRARATATTIVDAMTAGLGDVLADVSDILGVGVTVPGVVDVPHGAVIRSVNAPGLNGFPLRERLAAQFDLPFYLDNRSRTQAVAERLFGAGRGLTRFACVDTWEGLGVGLWVEGSGGAGVGGAAGEIGHTCVQIDGADCECGLRGCWETVASTRWLRGHAAAAGLEPTELFDAAHLVAGAAAGDLRYQVLLEEYAENLAIGLANIAQVFTPQALILNGDVLAGGEVFREELARRTAARCLPHISDSIRVVFSDLGATAPLLGAAGLVLSHTYQTAS